MRIILNAVRWIIGLPLAFLILLALVMHAVEPDEGPNVGDEQ